MALQAMLRRVGDAWELPARRATVRLEVAPSLYPPQVVPSRRAPLRPPDTRQNGRYGLLAEYSGPESRMSCDRDQRGRELFQQVNGAAAGGSSAGRHRAETYGQGARAGFAMSR
jgi:hypothetical protein